MARLRVLQADITLLSVDAIVTPANERLAGGGGVDGLVHRGAGPSVLEACQRIIDKIGSCKPGHAVVTPAGDLAARTIIHTVPPAWSAADAERHDAVLASCYRMALALAEKVDARTLAIPALGTGAGGFPKDRAAEIAVRTTRGFMDTPHKLHEVMFVCVDPENLASYEHLLQTAATTSALLA